MHFVALSAGLFVAVCELSLRSFGVLDDALFGGAVLDTVLGPEEDFEYRSTTTPAPYS